jgi:hypothetical protein
MDWQTTSAICSAGAVVGGFLIWFFRKAIPAARKWSRFADHVMGVPADPRTGQAEVPGIFERLDHQDGVLETIRHEVEFNNGTSVKDAVTRTEAATKELSDKLDAHLAATVPTTTINVTGSAAA